MAPDFTGHCLWLFPTSGLLALLVPSGRCRGQTVEKLSWSSICPSAMQVCPGCPSMTPRHQRHDFPWGNHSYCNTHLESDFSGPRPAACPGDCPMALCHVENREMLEELRIPMRWNKPCSPSWRAHDWRMSSRHEASQYSQERGHLPGLASVTAEVRWGHVVRQSLFGSYWSTSYYPRDLW